MAAALSRETAMWRGRLQFSNTITDIVYSFPPAPRPAHNPRLSPARISFNVNNFRRLPDGALSLDYSVNVPFECPLTHLLQPSPDSERDMRSSLLAAMRDPHPEVVDVQENLVSHVANLAAIEAVRQRRDGFSLVLEINSFDFPPELDFVNELINRGILAEEVNSIITLSENDDEDEDEDEEEDEDGGGGESTEVAGEVASSLVSRMSTVEFGKDCRSVESDCCSICLVDYEAEMRLKKTECSHVFHEDCLLSWLQRKAFCPSCPLCRADIAAN